MKFRAKIEDPSLLKSLIKMVNLCSKQHSELVIRLNETQVCLISKHIKDGLSVYAKIPARYMFSEYQCVGVSQEENEIFLGISSEKLLECLKSINTYQAKSIKLKLTQKDEIASLEIIVEQQANMDCSGVFNVNHYVPIDLISRAEWSSYGEVVVEETQEIFYLPPLKHIKNAADKHKNFDKYIKFFLQGRDKTLTLRTKSTLCEIATYYPNTEFREPHFEPDDDLVRFVELNSSRLATFLNSLDVGPNVKIEVNLVDQRLMNFQFVYEQITVDFTLPHMMSG